MNIGKTNTISFLWAVLFLAAGFGPDVSAQTTVINKRELLDDLKTLSADNMQGRETGTKGGKRARKYVVKRFKQVGLKKFGGKYRQKFSFKTDEGKSITGRNVVGYIRGGKNPRSFIVITAHYDHEGIKKGEIYNGADDNASGTSALFAIAKYFNRNRPDNSLIFVAFDAEEKGLSGAKHFVKTLSIKKESILLNINMDMISRNDRNELYVAGFYHYPFLKQYVDPIQKVSKIILLYGHDRPELKGDDWTNSTDHAPFHEAKIPFIYFGVEDHKDYHKPTDDFENINEKF